MRFQCYNYTMSYLLTLLKEIIIPRRCAVCEDEIHTGLFCTTCRENFILEKMLEDQEDINIVYLFYKYQGELWDAIRQLKFTKSKWVARRLQEEAKLFFPDGWDDFLKQYDIIETIPTSQDRIIERGYDVPREIFGYLPLTKQRILKRVRSTAPLYNLNQTLREQELDGCFRVDGDVSGKRILLLDDIYTTGSTAREAARTLRRAGAKYVDIIGFSAGKFNWD